MESRSLQIFFAAQEKAAARFACRLVTENHMVSAGARFIAPGLFLTRKIKSRVR
jgi:hypothetical protein